MYRLITPEELKRRLEGEAPPAVVDLRSDEDYARGHLPGARLVPAGVRVERWIPQRFPTTGDVVLYDGGGESTLAEAEASHLSHMWYHGVLVLQGGLQAWQAAGLPLAEAAPVDPMGVGRHIETRMPAPGVIPAEFIPRP